jgi:AcrR family transcriptional regulator
MSATASRRRSARRPARRIAPRNKPGTRYGVGQQRVASILAAAKHVLVDGGYADLTLRRVAAAAGMPLRHLQYYFPTKNDLLRSLCENICDDYIAKCDALSSREHPDPKRRFQACIEFLIDDNRDPVSNTIFFELWALACHDAYANRLLDRLYLHYRRYVARLITHLRPGLPERDVESRAVQIVALIEGLTLFIGRNKPRHEELGDVIRDASASVLGIAAARHAPAQRLTGRTT